MLSYLYRLSLTVHLHTDLQPDLYNGYADYLSKTTFPEGDSRTSNYSTLADVTAWNREHNSVRIFRYSLAQNKI